MSRFITIGKEDFNSNQIESFYDDHNDTITVRLIGGDSRSVSARYRMNLTGENFIVQVIPCKESLYSVYKQDDGSLTSYEVHYLCLCADGYVRPLDIAGGDIDISDSASNYVGVYSIYGEWLEKSERR